MKIDTMKIPVDYRVSLTQKERDEIKEVIKQGLSYREIGVMFGVDKKTIYYIRYPEKYKAELQKRKKAQNWKKYYETEQRTKYAQVHRAKKKEILSKENEPESF